MRRAIVGVDEALSNYTLDYYELVIDASHSFEYHFEEATNYWTGTKSEGAEGCVILEALIHVKS